MYIYFLFDQREKETALEELRLRLQAEQQEIVHTLTSNLQQTKVEELQDFLQKHVAEMQQVHDEEAQKLQQVRSAYTLQVNSGLL